MFVIKFFIGLVLSVLVFSANGTVTTTQRDTILTEKGLSTLEVIDCKKAILDLYQIYTFSSTRATKRIYSYNDELIAIDLWSGNDLVSFTMKIDGEWASVVIEDNFRYKTLIKHILKNSGMEESDIKTCFRKWKLD